MKTPKKRGRKQTTGSCASRAELEESVRWYYANTSISLERIGKRFGVSQPVAAKIVGAKP